MIVISGPG